MNDTDALTPSAFVIMPFTAELDPVYEFVIKPALDDAGFKAVLRADESANQQLIMRDVIVSIDEAQLIIADLTGGNPNVFYELGVAHALNRPVILMTQSIEELPFDLASYRVIQYTTQLGDAHRARSALAKVAMSAFTGDTLFSSPVSDALGITVTHPSLTDSDGDEGENPLGLLDYSDEANKLLLKMSASLGRITGHTEQLGNSMKESTERLTEVGSDRKQLTPREVRRFLGTVTDDMMKFVSDLTVENDTYESILTPLESSLEGLISLQFVGTAKQRDQLEDSMTSLSALREAIRGGLEGLAELESSISSLPPMERRFNRAQRDGTREINRLIALIKKTDAIAKRTEIIGRSRLQPA